MIVALLGYMGSGKSTVGKQLAETLDYEFHDLDSLIEKKEQKSISKIFEERGEIYFRKLESEVLVETLNSKREIVLALGGGTPCYASNMQKLQNGNTISIYLKLSITELVNRLSNEQWQRPLIREIPIKELPEFIGKHLFERGFFYNQADKILEVDGKSVAEQVTAIKSLL
ncbi:shikimate kinase [Croceivirga thetidis]|uniref:Shikimate kinase n=1 Tax=Croceivirga thetidis TaxID=2721623 RepID=A0ABX1GUB9_9FLAO|nr:shikimate kinase [Croceivirga thetidis]NKI33508.1 shikimate kinase [Croceivirga thetidis]